MVSTPYELDRSKGLAPMVMLAMHHLAYALVWFHFIRHDHLQYYYLDTYPDKKTCLVERDKAKILVTSNSMVIECIKLADADS